MRPPVGAILATPDEIPSPGACVREGRVGDRLWSVLLAREGDGVVAFVNRCPHAGFPLERPDGRVLLTPLAGGGKAILCAAHGAQFALLSGEALSGPGPGKGLERLAIKLDAGRIVVAPD